MLSLLQGYIIAARHKNFNTLGYKSLFFSIVHIRS